MTASATQHVDDGSFRRSSQRVVTVTHVAESRTEDSNRRNRNYLIAMTVRTLCFISLFLVPGVWRLLPLGGAVVLPVVSVMLANAVDHRRPEPVMFDDEATPLPALPAGEVIKGEVIEH